jgi:hypothetical protein
MDRFAPVEIAQPVKLLLGQFNHGGWENGINCAISHTKRGFNVCPNYSVSSISLDITLP